jgi:hypothetical protein
LHDATLLLYLLIFHSNNLARIASCHIATVLADANVHFQTQVGDFYELYNEDALAVAQYTSLKVVDRVKSKTALQKVRLLSIIKSSRFLHVGGVSFFFSPAMVARFGPAYDGLHLHM